MIKVYDSLKDRMLAKEKSDRNFLLWIIFMVFLVAVIFFLNVYVFFYVQVDGESMLPTLQDEDVLVANKLKAPKNGDIIIIDGEKYNSITGEYELLIKRVIATEGQTVEIKGGYVYVDGTKIIEPYLQEQGTTVSMGKTTWTLGEGEIFYLGDNRTNSNDSRYEPFGTCNKSQVIGVVSEWSLNVRWLNQFFQGVAKFFGGVR